MKKGCYTENRPSLLKKKKTKQPQQQKNLILFVPKDSACWATGEIKAEPEGQEMLQMLVLFYSLFAVGGSRDEADKDSSRKCSTKGRKGGVGQMLLWKDSGGFWKGNVCPVWGGRCPVLPEQGSANLFSERLWDTLINGRQRYPNPWNL